MHPVEIIAYAIILGGIALLVGFLMVTIPGKFQRRQPKRYHFKEPASTEYKNNVHANDIGDGSAVDNEKALKSFQY